MKRWTQPGTPILATFSHRKSYFREAVVRHQEHELNVALSGEGVYRLGHGRTLRLVAGEILLLPAGISHGIEVDHHLRMAVIHFHPTALDVVAVRQGPQSKLLKQLTTWADRLPPRKVVIPDAHATLERLAEEAVVEQNRQSLARESLLRSLATQAAVHFLRLMALEPQSDAPDETTRRILTVRRWIDRHFAEPCSMVGLAKMAHLAPTYFSARFRKVVGVPPITYVRDRRLEQARLLLERTSQPVKVVAWSVGFSDVSHFNHAFKQVTRLTPLAYRNQSQPPRRRT